METKRISKVDTSLYENAFTPISSKSPTDCSTSNDLSSIDGRTSAIGRQILFSPQSELSLNSSYTSEYASLELKIQSRFETPIALYWNDYDFLEEEEKNWIKTLPDSLKLSKMADIFNDLLEKIPSLVYYFTPEQTAQFQLKNEQSFEEFFAEFHSDYVEKDVSQLDCCIVIQDENIFIHPKTATVRNTLGNTIEYRTNHASLSNGKNVLFSGMLKRKNDRWEINNLSGHYKTPRSKLQTCFFALQEHKIPMDNVDFVECIVKDHKVISKNKIPTESMVEKLRSAIRSHPSFDDLII